MTVAAVEVTDDHRVALTTYDARTDLHSDDEVRLADERYDAAGEARREQIAARPREAHGFDVAPMCRQCGDGKHGACNGPAIIEVADEIQIHVCGCHEVDHTLMGGAA